MNAEIDRLGRELHQAAETVTVVTVPVEAIVRRGRRRQRRRGALGALAVSGIVLTLAVLVPGFRDGEGTSTVVVPPAATSTVPPSATPADRSPVRVVQADRPVDIGYGYVMALVEEGGANWVMMPEAAGFEAALEAAKNNGGNIAPDTISLRTSVTPEGTLYGGVFWTPGTFPTRVTVQTEGGEVLEAELLRLPGDPDWGTYHVDGRDLAEPRAAKITAYAQDGTVLVEFVR